MHPRGLLNSIISNRGFKDRHQLAIYRELGRSDFFNECPTTADPVASLAEFLAHFTIEDGRFNDFAAPFGVIPEFFRQSELECELRPLLEDMKIACDEGVASKESIEATLREHLARHQAHHRP